MLFTSGFAKFQSKSIKRNFGTSVWMVLHDLHAISAFGYYGSPIAVVVERECSKPAEYQQTLVTNRLQETLVLAQNTQNNEKIKIFWKTSLMTLTNDLFCYVTSSLHHPAFCIEKEVSARKRIQDISSQRRCNQEVTGWLTFDLLTQRAMRTFFLPFTFQIWSKKLKYSTLIVITLAKMFFLWVILTLTLEQLTLISIWILLLRYCTNTSMLHR